jgi:tripartite-type tricarboxylate transporter receptor subunit TctC
MTNYLFTRSASDGTVIGLAPGSIATAALFGSAGARYDARDLTWLGSLNSEVAVAVSRGDAPVKTAADLFSKDLIVGGAGASDNSVIFANLLNRLFNAKLRLVTGYKGSAENVLAMERGEVQGIAGWSYSSLITMRPDWVQQHKINILVQFSLTPHPDLKDVPTILEFARDDEQRALLRLIFAQASMGRVVFAPPRVAADRTKELRDAFDATLEDPEFKSDAERMRIEIVAPLKGAQVDSLVRELYLAPPGRIKEAATAVGGS